MSEAPCTAALIIKGQHFPCEFNSDHPGLAHSSPEAEAIWCGNEGPDFGVERYGPDR